MNNLYACGCSFTYGEGLYTAEDRYTATLSKALGMNEISYAKNAASNFVVYLQAKYAAEQADKDDIIVVSTTSELRTEWLVDGYNPYDLTAKDISYDNKQGTQVNPFEGDPEYTGKLISTQTWNHTWKDYKEMYPDEPRAKLDIISKYHVMFMPESAKRTYDISLFHLLQAQFLSKGLRFIFVIPDYMDNRSFIQEENKIVWHWFDVAKEYPDPLGTWHCSKEAHDILRNKILKKVNAWSKD